MHALAEFLKHAGECGVMAEFTRDPQSRATWRVEGVWRTVESVR